MADRREAVERAFPELEQIDDGDLRAGVVRLWTGAMADAGLEDLSGVPWFPPVQRELDIDDETLVGHVREVTRGAVALAEALDERRAVDADLLVAGALVHDASKLLEYDGMDETPVGDLLGHPHHGVHLVARADLPVELAHVVLSHSGRTAVEPATLEARLVRAADEAAADAIRAGVVGDLRDA